MSAGGSQEDSCEADIVCLIGPDANGLLAGAVAMDMPEIVTTEDVLDGAPRLAGRRVSVLRIVDFARVESAEYAADQLDLSLAEVHTTLAYYYGHPDEMRAIRHRQQALDDRLREEALSPPEPVDPSDS